MNNTDILITSLTQSSTAVVLVPNRTITQANLTNLGNYRLRLACGLKASAALPVSIQTSAGNVPIFNRYGNPVYTNQLKTRKYYNIGFGNGNTTVYANGQFVIFNNLCMGTITTSSSTVLAAKKGE